MGFSKEGDNSIQLKSMSVNTLMTKPREVQNRLISAVLYRELFPGNLDKSIVMLVMRLKALHEADKEEGLPIGSGRVAALVRPIYEATYATHTQPQDRLVRHLECEIPSDIRQFLVDNSLLFKADYFRYLAAIQQKDSSTSREEKREQFRQEESEVNEKTNPDSRKLLHQFIIDTLVNFIRLWAEENTDLFAHLQELNLRPEMWWSYMSEIHEVLKRELGGE